MADTEKDKSIHVLNENGEPLMEMNKIKRDGDSLLIEGKMMGAWPAEMYVGAKDVQRMIGMIFTSPSVIGYILMLPILARKKPKVKHIQSFKPNIQK